MEGAPPSQREALEEGGSHPSTSTSIPQVSPGRGGDRRAIRVGSGHFFFFFFFFFFLGKNQE